MDMGKSEFEDEYEGDDGAERLRHAREEQKLGEAILGAPIRALDPPVAVTVADSTSIRDAISVMIERHIGAVLVEHSGKLVGIFTERDVLRRVAISGVDLGKPVSEVMTRDPETLQESDFAAFALNRMIERGYRHIPVVDAEGKPQGVLSVRHIVAFIVSLMPQRVHNLPPEPKLGLPRAPDGG
jgi:CBS domain-containing protein